MKNSNNIIGNRTRDLPACSAVPQQTAPPRALLIQRQQTERVRNISTDILSSTGSLLGCTTN
jgi:hypothetical protein